MSDEPGSGGEDVRGRAVVLLQADDLGAGEILFEAQDVGDLGAAPAVDRLIVVADATQVAARLGEQFQPVVLGGVGVLIFVDQDVEEALAVGFEHVGMLAEDDQHVQQQVAEVAGVEGTQPLLVSGVKLGAAAVGEGLGFGGVDVLGTPAAVLPTVDEAGELAGGPTLVVEIGGGDQLLQQPQLIVCVEDGEVRLQADQFGMAAQHLGAGGVESAEPGHAFDRAAADRRHALLHLARGLVGEGDGEDLAWPGLSRGDEVGEAGGQCRRLPVPAPARTSTGPSVVSTASRCGALRPER
jgi:hypothetical protein